MPDKVFLETYPLYRKFTIKVSNVMNRIPGPQINAGCPTCGSVQTFAMNNEYYDGRQFANFSSAGEVVTARYLCLGCRTNQRDYHILISKELDWLQKVGQNPPWEIKGDKNIEKMLEGHKDYLSKGMICESQGYGIGAYAYYRRIAEEIIDQLIEDLASMIPASDVNKYKVAVEKVKTTRQASEKIELVKTLLPSTLIIQGMNPLGILHSALSEGLHAESDEECMDYAEMIRESLIYLSSQISISKSRGGAFSERMRKILDKKKT